MSIKFPKQYKVAAQLLQLASEEDINVKHILYNDKKYQYYNIKSVFAVVTKALQNWDVIETLIKESNILTDHSGLDPWRIRVIISELVIDQKDFPNPENYTLQTVIQYEEKFKKILSKTQTKSLIGSNARSETDVAKVRFIKINLIKDNVKSVIEKFQEDGWEKLETASNYDDYLQQLRDLEPNSPVFLQDFHFQEVLAFPPGTELQSHELYLNGSVFFMDKASCLSPFLLAPERNSHVLDMCAAPGLKTLQLASFVTSGKVYAVERDAARYKTLQMMIDQSGADNVITVLQDVTKLNVHQYKHVEYILVDPSCTGSGIRARQPSASLKTRLDEKTRVEKLSGFQLTLLRFALTRFPAAKRVVYSTCSLNVEENEKVVEAALNSYYHNFDVVSVQDKLPGWKNFGSKDFQFGSKCVYCQPEIDQTNGFFVAVFERKKKPLTTSCVNGENNNYKSENHFKGRKRKSHEEHYGDVNEHLKIPSHKKHKLEHGQADKKEKGEVIATKTLHKVKTQRVKANGKQLSLSEKKRSRRKMFKIKNKIRPQSSTHKSTKVKIKIKDANSLVENIDKTKCFNENSNKISRAKSRQNREKKLKLSLDSKSKNMKMKDSEGGEEKQVKRKKNYDSFHENLIESTESENTPFVKKKEKRKREVTDMNEHERAKAKNVESEIRTFESIETNSSSRDKVKKKSTNKVSSEIIYTDESGQTLKNKRKKNHSLKQGDANTDPDFHIKENAENIIDPDESGQTLKRKHKKNHSSKHGNVNTDPDFHIKENADKVIDPNESYANMKEINCESEKIWPQKHKKTLLLDHNETSFIGIANDDKTYNRATPGDINENNSKKIPSKSDECGDEETLKKKHKKKHSSNHYDSNITNHIHDNKTIDKAFIAEFSDKTTQEGYSESTDWEEKRTHKKKHKKKRSLDDHRINITDNVHDES